MEDGGSRLSAYSNWARLQGSCQLLDASPNFPRVDRRKPKHDAIAPRTAVGIAAERNYFDIVPGGRLGRLLGENSA